MAFVVLQCLWLSVVRKPLTIQRMHSYCISTLVLKKPEIEIDAMYRIERQDQLYKAFPQALFFSPTIVVFSALTLLLPLSGVFAPGSLTVATKNSTEIEHCVVPTGNISTPDTPDSTSLYTTVAGQWLNVSTRATVLAMQWLVEQRIPDLPQACGPNCRYNVSVPSFFFQCTPNPSSLPYNQAGDNYTGFTTLWNGTTDPTSMGTFYIAWQSNGPNGTRGNASCLTFQAQYDVQVRIIALSNSSSIIFLNVDSRSRREEVSNLLRRTSRK